MKRRNKKKIYVYQSQGIALLMISSVLYCIGFFMAIGIAGHLEMHNKIEPVTVIVALAIFAVAIILQKIDEYLNTKTYYVEDTANERTPTKKPINFFDDIAAIDNLFEEEEKNRR